MKLGLGLWLRLRVGPVCGDEARVRVRVTESIATGSSGAEDAAISIENCSTPKHLPMAMTESVVCNTANLANKAFVLSA